MSSVGHLHSPPDRHRKARKSKDSRDSKRISRELVKLLLYEERGSNDLQQMLLQTTEQLRLEKQRADVAERKVNDALTHMKTLNAARLAALRDANHANNELSLYKAQLESAQNEINRAQSILVSLETQKHEAESDAARARTTARQLRQEKVIAEAREEGRRLGLQEGLERGRQLGYRRGRATGYAHGRSNGERGLQDDHGDEEGYRSPSPEIHHRLQVPVAPISPVVAPRSTRVVPAVHPPPSIAPPSQQGLPRHIMVDIPPDNLIPHLDEDLRIRLPPPHEMKPELSPLLEHSLPQLPTVPEEEPALMIPAPATTRAESSSPVLRSNSSTPRQRRAHHRTSSESGSTTISQLDMLSEPSHLADRANAGTPLSVIQEILSAQASPHATASADSHGPSRRGSSPQLHESMALGSNPVSVGLEKGSHGPHGYRPSSASLRSSVSSHDTRLQPQTVEDRRRSGSSTSTIGIFIEPPSRPHSGTSLTADAAQPFGGGFLSPAHAHIPVALPEPSRETEVVIPNVLSMTASVATGGSAPIILPDDELPLGFVPIGSFTPGPGTVPLTGMALPTSPMNGFVGGGIVHVPIADSNNGVSGRASRGSRRQAVDSDSSSVTSSSSSSSDSLTTPPGRKASTSNPIPLTTDDVMPIQTQQPVEAAARPRGNARRRGRGRR